MPTEYYSPNPREQRQLEDVMSSSSPVTKYRDPFKAAPQEPEAEAGRMEWGYRKPREYTDLTPRGPDDSGRPPLAEDRREPTLNRRNPALALEVQYDRLRDLSDVVRDMGMGRSPGQQVSVATVWLL